MYQNDNDPYNTFANVYKSVVDKHTPLKCKKVKANQTPFMTKKLSKCT